MFISLMYAMQLSLLFFIMLLVNKFHMFHLRSSYQTSELEVIQRLLLNNIALCLPRQIPKSSKGKDWFWYVDRDVTLEQLERVSAEFLLILNQCPSKLKNKIMKSSKAISDQVRPTHSGVFVTY